MYAIYLISYNKFGYLKNSLNTKNVPHGDKVVMPSVKPVLADTLAECKKWHRQTSAVKFADTLSLRLKYVQYHSDFMQPYLHTQPYTIRVVDLSDGAIVHQIDSYSFRSNTL